MRTLICLAFVAILLSAWTPAAQADLTEDLVAYYTFDDGSATDVSGNGRHGTLHNGVSFATGVNGHGAIFDGIDDWIEVNLPITGVDWAVSVWFRIDGFDSDYTDWYNIISNQPENFALGSDSELRDLRDYCSGSDTATSPDIIHPGNTYHVVFQNNGGVTTIYLNGTSVATGGPCTSPTELTTIGQWYADDPHSENREPFFGMMDEMRVYDRSLTPDEVTALTGITATIDQTWGQAKALYR